MKTFTSIFYLLVITLFSCGNSSTAKSDEKNKDADQNENDSTENKEMVEESKAETMDADWTGTYTDGFENSMEIKGPAANGEIIFKITQASETCEGAMIDGKAYLTNENIANFDSEDDCHLSFTYNSGVIEIIETDCDNYHGASCGLFDGKYKKQK